VSPRFRRDERGEGVISVAIAVLIMAFLGVLVWGGFKLTLQSTQGKVDEQVEKIGK
jgi:TRAP-type C4-dicarboxylate transport system permease small subunit